ncbi:MAG TPA: response regulator [Desulfobacterales bacterium]
MSPAHNILVVDDEPVVREVLEEALELQGEKVTSCGTARAGLQELEAGAFDLVLLDVNLPDMDGFEALSRMRKHWEDLLVVMMTGDATIESAVEALKGGAYDYLRKPIHIEELRKTIKYALDHRELDRARRQSEVALRESESRFRALVENSLIGICIIQNNRIIYQNPQNRSLFPLAVDIPLNRLVNYAHPDDTQKVIAAYKDLISGARMSVEEEFRLFPRGQEDNDPEMHWVQCRASVFQYRGEDAVLINMMDISRSKELEQILRLKSKMISLGRVAAGIAHEIRNPLTGINSYLYTMEDLFDAEELSDADLHMMKTIVEQMQMASNKIESVIKRVLDFSRPGAPSMTLITANDPLQEAVNLSAVSLRKKGIEIRIQLDPDLPQCYGDAHLIEQVMLNMIDNAVKAMEKKNDGDKILRLSSWSRDNSVFLSVSDTGSGIPLALREKIFDPFFTTESDGSGIGLAIAQRIIHDHNGAIRVGSNEWGGAELTIELPIEKRQELR